MKTNGVFQKSTRMIDLQMSNTSFEEYYFIDPTDTNVTYALINSYQAGYHLVKIRTDEDQGIPSDTME
jgi:hypothetical protein